MKRVYFASASKGSRKLAEIYVDILSLNHFVFAPTLGFRGTETLQIRGSIMEVCFHLVCGWADVVVALNEGVKTEGVWEELILAELQAVPSCLFSPFGKAVHYHQAYEVEKFKDVLKWVNEL